MERKEGAERRSGGSVRPTEKRTHTEESRNSSWLMIRASTILSQHKVESASLQCDAEDSRKGEEFEEPIKSIHK
jgi:hypothetical protein